MFQTDDKGKVVAAVSCNFVVMVAGDTVSVLGTPPVKDGVFVKIAPYADDVENVKGDLIETLLRCGQAV